MNTRSHASIAVVTLALLAGCQATSRSSVPIPKDQAGTPLIARSILFGNPERAAPQISPDGAHLAWLADKDGVPNVWVAPVGDLAAAKPVTSDTTRGVRSFQWAYDNKTILYPQDKGGDEDWHIHATDVTTMTTRDLTPIDGIQGRILAVSHRIPAEILVQINDRDKSLDDVYRVHLASGERKLVLQNEGFVSIVADEDYNIRFGSKMNPAGVTSRHKSIQARRMKKPTEDAVGLFCLAREKFDQRIRYAARKSSCNLVRSFASARF